MRTIIRWMWWLVLVPAAVVLSMDSATADGSASGCPDCPELLWTLLKITLRRFGLRITFAPGFGSKAEDPTDAEPDPDP